MKPVTYRDAGVDIEKAEKSLQKIKSWIGQTHNKNVLKNIGAFGGFFELPVSEYHQPVLVSSTDGVGTKLKIAIMMNKHNTVGQDLVNHCIDDIAVCGAKPLFFLDYFACGKLDSQVYEDIMAGFVTACKAAELPLVGGETAEMPDMYQPGEYDLAGTIVGVVEKNRIVDGSSIRAGDQILGVASNGLHTNGYTLARKVLFSRYQLSEYISSVDNILGDELLKVHRNYYPLIKQTGENFTIKGMAHITGGGLFNNTRRVVPEGLIPEFNWGNWEIPAIFNLIREIGNVPDTDFRRTFNLGIGLVFIVSKEDAVEMLHSGDKSEDAFIHIGEIKSA